MLHSFPSKNICQKVGENIAISEWKYFPSTLVQVILIRGRIFSIIVLKQLLHNMQMLCVQTGSCPELNRGNNGQSDELVHNGSSLPHRRGKIFIHLQLFELYFYYFNVLSFVYYDVILSVHIRRTLHIQF